MKKILSLVLILVVIVTSGFSVCADEIGDIAYPSSKTECNIVYFGDSTSIGFGCKGFSYDNFAINNTVPTSNTYPKLLTKLFKKTGFYEKVSADYYVMIGCRTNELMAILNTEYRNKAFKQEMNEETPYGKETGYLVDHINSYVQGLKMKDASQLQDKVTNSIKNADYIVLDNLMSTFGTYFITKAMNMANLEGLSSKYSIHSKSTLDSIKDLDPGIRTEANNVYNTINSFIGMLPVDKKIVTSASELLSYCYADALNTLDKCVSEIRSINKDAKILVVGAYDPLSELKISYGPINAKLGTLVDSMYFDSINNYVKNNLKNSNEYSFVELEKIQNFVDSFACGSVKVAMKNGKCKLSGDKHAVAALDNLISINRPDSFENMFMKLSEADKAKICKLMIKSSKTGINASAISLENIKLETLFADYAVEVNKYLKGKTSLNKFPEIYLILTNFMEQAYLYDGVGIHPSGKGCKQKYDAVSQAVVKMLAQSHPYKAKKPTFTVKKGKTVVAASNINYVYGDKVTSVKSSNKKVATVANKTKLKALKKGTSKITVKFRSGLSKSYTVKVK